MKTFFKILLIPISLIVIFTGGVIVVVLFALVAFSVNLLLKIPKVEKGLDDIIIDKAEQQNLVDEANRILNAEKD